MKQINFETDNARMIFFSEANFLYVEVKENANYDLETTKRTFEKIFSVKGEQEIYVLIDTKGLSFDYIPKETLAWLADNPYVKYQKKLAILINNTGLLLLGNFYLGFFKPKTNTKVFKSIKGALKWLGIESQKTMIEIIESSLQHTN